ncbi:MAG: DUF5695 domain-containing protein [Myxococcales bacterium]
MNTRLRSLAFSSLFVTAALLVASRASAQTLSNTNFNVKIGTNGEINSFQLAGDAFPTNYVLNGTNAPAGFAASKDHAWVGELMFKYRTGTGAWQTALTSAGGGRTITSTATSVTVSYDFSAFKVVETYALVDDYLSWKIAITNSGSQPLEFGDIGLPLPFNEYWFGNDVIYEQRTVYHSFIGNDSSYVTVKRPSGVGPFLLLIPDAATGAGFEYKDNWTVEEHPGSVWAQGGSNKWPTGLEVYYIKSNVIKSTNQGYLPNTSVTVAVNGTQTYGFKFYKVADDQTVKDTLYKQGLIDVTAVPGMMFATNMTGKFDLRTSTTIDSVTPQFPDKTTLTAIPGGTDGHHVYQVSFRQLGPNNVTVKYAGGKTTTLQFYALEPIDAAFQRHATFMVASTQWTSGDLNGVLDDWMMDSKKKRGATGGWGWGDDWGWTHGEFLAEKNAQSPVPTEINALDTYLDAVWARAVNDTSYIVQDWWCPAGVSAANPMDCYYDRAYAYPHAFNTFFSMYKVANLYPSIVTYKHTADTYLLRAYDILHTLYNGHGDPGTGYMGLQTLPEIAAALKAAGHTAESTQVTQVLTTLHNAFKNSKYPYGSEYSYDNTGEEAVFTAGKVNNDLNILKAVNLKTRACRGQEPAWYWYADPVTLNGEGWWQFQYTASLAGICMDDWVRNHSTTPEVDERLNYAAKIANVSAINSGQIDADPANLGTVAWTYQAMKGNVYRGNAENGKLHNGWRQMAGEADLGLFGAIRILSADIAVDPIFGLFGYGADVTQTGTCLSVTPLDGVNKKLNFITQKLHLELNRDQYTGATVSTAKDYMGFTLRNQMTAAAHTTLVTVEGLAPGTYPVTLDNAAAGMLTATAGQASTVSLSIGTNASYSVRIGAGCGSTTNGAGGASSGGAANGGDGSGGTSSPTGGAGTVPGGGPSTGSGGVGVPGGGASSIPGGGAFNPSAGNGTGDGAGAAGSGNQASGCSCSTVKANGGSGALMTLGIAGALAGVGARRRRRTQP